MRVADEIVRLKQLDPEEPLFILRGQDILAPDVIEHWAVLAELADVTPSAKIREAREWIEIMAEWQPRRLPD